MPGTTLMREALRPLYQAARNAHPGLLIQRGLDEHSEDDKEIKTRHIARVCVTSAGEFYQRAYARWQQVTADELRFRQVILPLQARLFAGLTGSGMLETGCAIGHSHGAPYIPGSSVKGVVNAHVRRQFEGEGAAICDELFGAPATDERPAGLSGLITFHDAWWVPGSAPSPLVQEVVTTHHPEYYGQEGRTPATDFDSPVPNAQVAVHGSFLFVLEGPVAWLELAAQMLVAALSTRGVGAKTRTSYGLFQPAPSVPAEPCCAWVDETITGLMVKNRSQEGDTLRGKALATAWAAIGDVDLKAVALKDIRSRWQANGWWDDPSGRSARQAKEIYEADPASDQESS